MSQLVGEGVVHVSLDARDVDRQLPAVGREGGKRFSSGFASSLKGLGAAVGGALTVQAVGGFLKGAVSGASDLNETVSKTNVIFGKASKQVIDFASGGAGAFGQTKQQLLDAAGTFGTFGKAAGLQGKALGGFSTQLSGLSSDLSSFFNTDPTDAAAAIAAALRGESEPIRAYGVLLDEASLKAEALQQGLLKPVKDQAKIKQYQVNAINAQKAYNAEVDKSGKHSLASISAQAKLGTAQAALTKATEGTLPALTQQQKILAAHSLILKQTKDAQGDFSRTSGGLANQQRILSASFKDFRTEAGAKLLPIVLKVVKAMVALFNGTSPVTPVLNKLKAAFKQAVPVVVAIGKALLDVGQYLAHHKVALAATATVIGIITAAYIAWKVAQGISFALLLLSTPGTLLNAAASAAAAVATGAWAVATFLLTTPLGLLVLAVVAVVAVIVLAIKYHKQIEAVVTKVWHAILGVVTKAVGAVVGFVKSHWPLLLAIITGPIGLAVLFISKHLSQIKAIFSTVLGAVKGIVSGLWGDVVGIITGGAKNIVDGIKAIPGRIRALAGVFGDAGRFIIHAFVDGFKKAAGVLGGIASSIFAALKVLINNAIDGINNALQFSISIGFGKHISIDAPDIPHLARGTDSFAGGFARVGEEGPENVLLPRGSRVFTARDSAAAGAGVYIASQTVVAHNYQDFVAQSRRTSQQAALGGRRGPR